MAGRTSPVGESAQTADTAEIARLMDVADGAVLVGVAMLQSSTFNAWLAWPGIAIGVFLIVGSFEFVGSFEEMGWKFAGAIVPIAYTAWSLWLVVTGILLLAA